MLFKEFGGVDAFPICLDTKDPEEIIATVKAIAPTFGGINLEDISAPRCFEIEERLKAELDIPVFHDDQHGTAVVVLAALLNATKLHRQAARGPARARRRPRRGGRRGREDPARRRASRHVIGCDSRGALHTDRADYLDGSMTAGQALVRRVHQPRAALGRPGRRDRRRRPVRRALRRPRDAGRGARAHEPRRDGLRDGQPEPRGHARGGRARTRASSPPAARTTRTRSTTCSASRASSAARWTSARARSPRR